MKTATETINNTITITCEVNRIKCRSEEDGFTALLCTTKDGDVINVVGHLPPVEKGGEYKFFGAWTTHPKWGDQFVAKYYENSIPTSLESIEKYLIGQILYIGPKNVKKIVEKFGKDTFTILNNEPERLLEISGIGLYKMEQIKKSWDEKSTNGRMDLYLFFGKYGIETKSVERIYKQYGDESINKIKENPYVLADEVWGIGFNTADEIAMKLGYDKNSYNRLRSGLLYTLRQSGQKGHCYQEWDELAKEANKTLTCDMGLVSKAIAGMVFDKSVVTENRMVDGTMKRLVYLPEIWTAETETAVLLRKINSSVNSLPKDFDFSLVESGDIEYNETQLNAIKTALSSKVFVLTGGPGTGKTTTTLGIIKMLQSKDVPFLLAAPTGRAAKRLAEATGVEEAKTIHRLLEYNKESGCFQRDKDNPLEGKVLIVDECSMVDIRLMHSLLQAVPSNMSIIFIGDVDQLPSVGEGNVLRDIIESNVFSVVRLTQIFRQARTSRIIMNAHEINKGVIPDLNNYPKADFYFHHHEYEKDIIAHVLFILKEKLLAGGKVDLSNIQVLSPMKIGEAGTISLNKAIQEAVNSREEENGVDFGDYKFKTGDKVMQIRNNYKKGVYNGDIGYITRIDYDVKLLTVCFDGSVVNYEFSELDELTLAYASTVHKSQGSEYPVVIMVLHSSQSIMLQRNLLYTGVTRAKKLLIIVGERKAVETAVRNNQIAKRNTLLESRLKQTALPVSETQTEHQI